ncbi:ParB N-terminal domain-containing protein [Corallococcus macrosporus]|uniref:ParB N-terminal domain-containing protein n=2 Tax=Corallococcus macrosporus TaxID=35 RepID=A0ABS3D9A0_9BACT|nr:ParB N-terminal domain-containing protein [Corallococcus macrosporus]
MPGTPGENATPEGSAQTDLPGEGGQTMSTTASDTEAREAGGEGSSASHGADASASGGEGRDSEKASEAGEGSGSASATKAGQAAGEGSGSVSASEAGGEGSGSGRSPDASASGGEGSGSESASEASMAGGEGRGSANASEANKAEGEGSGSANASEAGKAGDEGRGASGEPSSSEARDAGAGAEAQAEGSSQDASTGPGRYVELASGERVQDGSGMGSDGGGEAKDVLAEPRSGPVSGADDALLGAGIWDVASRASQEDASPEASSNEDAATREGEPHAEAIEPRVMGQVTAMVLPLERLEEDTTFRLRDEGDVSELATDLARLGQLFPVDVRPRGEDRYQLICGFRRVAALRFLKRDQVQVRVHEELSDEDALLLSLAEAIHASPVEHDVLEAKRESLEAEGRLTAPVRDMLEKALATEETLAPEGVEEEIDADELAVDVAQRMGALNQDLSLLADVFAALDESRKAELLMQLRYSAQLVAYLEGL